MTYGNEYPGRILPLSEDTSTSTIWASRLTTSSIGSDRGQRWAKYWLSQAYPVMLVIRTSDGKIRWMKVTDYLQQYGKDTKQIIFEGEPFTAPNVAKLRDKVLHESKGN